MESDLPELRPFQSQSFDGVPVFAPKSLTSAAAAKASKGLPFEELGKGFAKGESWGSRSKMLLFSEPNTDEALQKRLVVFWWWVVIL